MIIKTTLAEHNYWCNVYDIGCQQHLMKTLMNLHLYFKNDDDKIVRNYNNLKFLQTLRLCMTHILEMIEHKTIQNCIESY